MNKMAIVAEMKVMHGVNSMDFCSPKLIWLLLLLLSTRSTSSKDQHHLNGAFYTAPFPGVTRQHAGWYQVVCIRSLPSGKEQHISLTGYRFALSKCNASFQTIICGIMKCLIHHLVYHTALFLIRNSFHNQRNVTAAHAHGISSFHLCSPPS